jgi:hypothetical protein
MLNFDNRFVRDLPGDQRTAQQPRQVFGACWSPVAPTPVAAPTTARPFARSRGSLDLDEQAMAAPAMLGALAGNALLPGMASYASCYGGHQFGQWAGQLGDGRAILLGRSGQPARAALRTAAQGRRPDAVLAPRRRARRAALVDPRVPVQRGDASPRRADDARAEPGRHR